MMATTPQQTFWLALAQALQEKKGMAAAMEQVRVAMKTDPLAETAAGLIREIHAGQKLSAAMRNHLDVFDPKIMAAVEAGEDATNLGEVAAQIADAVEEGDADRLAAIRQSSAQAASVFQEILGEALRAGATDIHIEPLEHGRARIRQRIDGVLHDVRTLPEGSAGPLAMRIKAMSSLDVTQRGLPQDGIMLIQKDGHDLDVRLSTIPVWQGERLCLRLIHRQAMNFDLGALGLTPENLATVRRFCHVPAGVVIVNGPTGAGKTTLLYSMLQEIDQVGEMIITVEDPVEYAFGRLSQIQIRPEIGLTFIRAIRSILRQDPDVIMIGEIRDREVLETCVQCAMTGHLVLTTLHATTSAGAVRRMLDIGTPAFMLNSSVAGIVSLRLARKLCPQCKQPAKPDPNTIPHQAREILEQQKGATLFGARGCPACSQTGYTGRIAIHEILVMNDSLRQAASTDATTSQLRDVAVRTGMKTMLQDGLGKVADGITSLEEVLRIVPVEAYE